MITTLAYAALLATHLAAPKAEMVTIREYDFEKLEPDPLDPNGLQRVLRGHSYAVQGRRVSSWTLTIGTFRDVRTTKLVGTNPPSGVLTYKTSNDGKVLSYQCYPIRFDPATMKQFTQFIAANSNAAAGGSGQATLPAAFNNGRDSDVKVSFLAEESNRTRMIDGIRYVSSATRMNSEDGETWTIAWSPTDKKLANKAPTEIYQYSVNNGEKRLLTFERDFNFKSVTRRAKKSDF